MSKLVYVQAQSDHIESMFRGSPLAAIEELVWNSLDADAHEVKVDLIQNALGGVEAVRVTDDGTGIDILGVDKTFGNLGGSWKRDDAAQTVSHRRLHGRHGCGRFKAFALGCHVEWRTTVTEGGERVSYVIAGEADRPGVFEIESAPQVGAPGTEVYIENVRGTVDTLLTTEETVQNLAAKFALYLKSYPDVRIYFNGIPVTPVIVQKRTSDYTLTVGDGAEAKLEIIEWKRKFVGSGRLIFAGPDGFQLHEQSAGVRSGTDSSFTAYLVSPRFPALAAENALVMDELHPEVRLYLDEAKKAIKAHFLAYGEEKSPFELEWAERFAALTKEERKQLLVILRKSLKLK